ncbi:MAG TPA: hypothetical protein VGJ03_06685 [Acidimicrobiales bacterium]|jgi:hypothetical protein
MPSTTHSVMARFDEPDVAREAMVDLEERGIESAAIHLVEQPATIPTREGGLHADLSASRRIAGNFARDGVVGAVIGAFVFVGAFVLIGVEPFGVAVLVGVIAGGIAGALMGGFFGAAWRLPVNEDALDTYALDPSDPQGVAVEVRVEDPDVAAEAIAVLRAHHPRMLERRAA